MSSKPVIIVMGLNDAPLKRGLDGVRSQMRSVQAAAQEMGGSTRSSAMASSAAIRVMEGNLANNVRAAERFIATIKPLSGFLQAAFPAVGAIALLGVFAEMATKVTAFAKKINEIPPNPFAELVSSGRLANDQLSITNDRLAMEIEKLEHKPVNSLALALDQAKESSDKLYASLQKANQAFSEAMGKDNIGSLKGLWKNMEPTDAAVADIKKAHGGVQAVLDDHKTTIDDAIRSGDPENIRQARAAQMVDLQGAYQQQDERLQFGLDAALHKQANFNGPYSSGTDQSKVIEKYQAALAQSQNEQGEAGGNYGQSIMQPKKDALEAAKANQDALKQAQEAMLQQWHKNLDDLEAIYGKDLAMEAHFWEQRAMLTKNGGIASATALDEANKAIAQLKTQGNRDSAEFNKLSAESVLTASVDLSRGDNGEMKSQGAGAVEYLRNLNEGISLQHANANAIAEASLRMAEMTGQMSRLGVAQAMAALHTQEYAAATDALAVALANARSLPAGFERDQRVAGLQNQGAQMAGQRSVQQMQDQQSISSQQIGPAIQQMLGRMEQDWTNMSASIVQVITRGVDSLNDDIVKAMTGQGKKGDFGRTLMQTGQGALKTALQAAEGMGLKALHIGPGAKADGSQNNPFYVVMAGAGGSGGGGIASVAGTAMSKIAGAPSVWKGVGGWLGGLLQGHFAGGGDVAAGYPAMVGERGPEIFVPHTAGRIVPNHALGGGGGSSHTYMVDARGSNDPAAIQAAVARALPHAVAASVQANHQHDMRRPQSR